MNTVRQIGRRFSACGRVSIYTIRKYRHIRRRRRNFFIFYIINHVFDAALRAIKQKFNKSLYKRIYDMFFNFRMIAYFNFLRIRSYFILYFF
jgi:hypothetical protein